MSEPAGPPVLGWAIAVDDAARSVLTNVMLPDVTTVTSTVNGQILVCRGREVMAADAVGFGAAPEPFPHVAGQSPGCGRWARIRLHRRPLPWRAGCWP